MNTAIMWFTIALFAPANARDLPPLPVVDGPTAQRLASREVLVVVGGQGTLVTGTVTALIDAPVERVWSVLTDYALQPHWVPNMNEVRVLSREGDVAVCASLIRLLWPISNRSWHSRMESRAERIDGVDVFVTTWTHIPGSGNIIENTGYWVVQPWEAGGTLLHYEFRADAGLRIPDFIEQFVTGRLLPGGVEGLRRLSGAPSGG